MNYKTNGRGFRFYDPIPTKYGHEVTVSESSAAMQPCLWLKVELTPEMAEGVSNIPPEEAMAHLTFAQAAGLIRVLAEAMANHYQVRFEEDDDE